MLKQLVDKFLEFISSWGKKTTPHPEELLKVEPIIEVVVEKPILLEEPVQKKPRKKTSNASKK